MPSSNYNRRQFLGMAGAAAGAGLLGAYAAGAERPNILYIMADDHASHAISAYGSIINRTPNIDRIAGGGMRMTNCFCTNSICTPSRGAILTGQYSHKNGVYTLNDQIDPNRNNVAKELQKAGYQTGMIGKWHLGTDPAGFDYWNILPGQGVYYNPDFLTRDGRKKYNGYCTDIIGDLSLEFLKQRDKQKPFFLMSHHKAPHRPWQPGPKYAHLFDGQTIAEPDNLYDQYQGKPKSVSVNNIMILNIDFAETFLDYAGVKPPADMQGRSFRAILEGHTPKNWRTSMYYRYWMHNTSDHHVPAHYGVRTRKWKLIYYYGKPLGMKGANPPDTEPDWELFDMEKDPREMHNLYHDLKYAGIVKQLKTEMDKLQKEVGDSPV